MKLTTSSGNSIPAAIDVLVDGALDTVVKPSLLLLKDQNTTGNVNVTLAGKPSRTVVLDVHLVQAKNILITEVRAVNTTITAGNFYFGQG